MRHIRLGCRGLRKSWADERGASYGKSHSHAICGIRCTVCYTGTIIQAGIVPHGEGHSDGLQLKNCTWEDLKLCCWSSYSTAFSAIRQPGRIVFDTLPSGRDVSEGLLATPASGQTSLATLEGTSLLRHLLFRPCFGHMLCSASPKTRDCSSALQACHSCVSTLCMYVEVHY